MRRPTTTGTLVTAALAIACGNGSAADRAPSPTEVAVAPTAEAPSGDVAAPADFRLDDIANAALADPAGVRLLAWMVIERDGNPGFRFESCVVVQALDAGGHTEWVVEHLFRRPDAPTPRWQLALTHTSGGPDLVGMTHFHFARFKERPRNKDLYASFDGIDGLHWTFDAGSGFHVVDCGVNRAAWRETTGEEPTRSCSDARVVVVGTTIVDHGVFDARPLRRRISAPGTTAGSIGDLGEADPVLLRSTTNIPAKLGTTFGIRVRVDGSPRTTAAGDLADVAVIQARMRVTHPPVKNPSTGAIVTVDEWSWPISLGVPLFGGWRFDDPTEVVPGRWLMQVWYGDRVLAEQAYDVE
jgi:hypothetical protein